MLQLLPNWLYGFVPPDWWPDKPREMYFYTLVIGPIQPFADVQTFNQVFSTQAETLVFGGSALVTTNTNDVIHAPLSGSFARFAARLRNPAGNITYSGGTVGAVGGALPGFVPFESLFSPWQHCAKRAALWPIPIPVPKAGALLLDLQNFHNTVVRVRITYACANLYPEREAAA